MPTILSDLNEGFVTGEMKEKLREKIKSRTLGKRRYMRVGVCVNRLSLRWCVARRALLFSRRVTEILFREQP
jgi:hypothetical protein